ncbi:phosphatidylethanolamine N-methyltransferase [Acrasis kona]|uniref:CHO2 n=1 Tax=Acrasis kona TaxID=1008807 RepID=A0AAW2ZIL7_9EUKA
MSGNEISLTIPDKKRARHINKPSLAFQRVFRCIPAFVIFGGPLLSIYWSFFNIHYYFIFAVGFCIFQLYYSCYIGYYAYNCISNARENNSKDWRQEYENYKKQNKDQAVLQWDDIVHYVIITAYKENVSILNDTLNAIAESSIAHQIIPVLGMEQREEGCDEKASALVQKFQSKFKGMLYTVHPKGIPGEMAGKSSNSNWTYRTGVVPDINKRGLETDNVVVSICDADSLYNVKHFDVLTFKYCTLPNRHSLAYQGPMVNFANVESVPAVIRLMSVVISMHELSHVYNCKNNQIFPFSTYSYSYRMIKDNDGWDPDFVAEDWHQFLKLYFNTGGQVSLEALPYPIVCYSVESDSFWSSIKERFEQAKRHAIALQEVVYIFTRCMNIITGHSTGPAPKIAGTLSVFTKTIFPHMIATYHLFLLGYSFFVFQMYFWIPHWVNPDDSAIVNTFWAIAFNLVNFLSAITLFVMSLNTHRMINYIKNEDGRWWRPVIFLIEWLLFAPIGNFLFTFIPTFIAASRLVWKDMLDFEYVCAAKPESEIEVVVD